MELKWAWARMSWASLCRGCPGKTAEPEVGTNWDPRVFCTQVALAGWLEPFEHGKEGGSGTRVLCIEGCLGKSSGAEASVNLGWTGMLCAYVTLARQLKL